MRLRLLTVVLALLAVGWYSYHYYQSVQPIVDSYESCLAAKGSTLLTSYPSTCVTQNGQSFTEPVIEGIDQEDIPEITTEELEIGWYYGTETQYKPGTPQEWEYNDSGKSSCWHAPQTLCQ